MEFRILGPLEVREAGRALPLGGAKQRALLAILLLHANDLLSSDRLVDELWGEEPPETARNVIQVYVSQIRKVLASATSGSGDRATLETRQPGYVLHVAPEDFDLTRFERLAARGRSALTDDDAAVATLAFEDALTLWRGDPLADFRLEPFAQREIDRLEEMRLTVLEDLFEARLAMGRGGALTPELEVLIAEHPLRERLRGHLMLALYQGGRQAEALEIYRAGAELLAEDLGIDPGPALQHLHEQILRQDPSLTAPEAERRVTVGSSGDERQSVTVVAAVGVDEDAFTGAIAAAGGTALEPGDGVAFAAFGVPTPHGDDAERAAVAAQHVAATGPAVGVASSRVALSAEADPLAALREVAAALAARPGRVTVDEDAARRLRSQFQMDDVEGAMLLAPGRRTGDVPATPLVGRDRELREIAEAFDDLREGRGQVLLIEGDTGMGKTRSLWEASVLAGDAVAWLQASCAAAWIPAPYLVLSRALRRFVDADDAAGPDDVRTRLAARLARVPETAGIADALDPLVERTTSGDEPGDRLASALGRLVSRLAAQGPVVLAIDDVDQIDDAAAAVVADLLAITDAEPLAVILTARADSDAPGWPLWLLAESSFRHRLRRVDLGPLSDEDAGHLSDALSPTGALDRPSRTDIVARAEGNPLFLEELTDALVAGGGLERTSGWTLSLTTAGALMPPRLEDLLAMRIQGLPPDARRLAQAAAVLGGEAGVGSLARVGEVDDVPQAIAVVLRSQVMREAGRAPELRLRFHHGLLREAALTTLTPDRARAMYGRAADLNTGEGFPPERVAFYLYRAGRWAEALEALTTVAERTERTAPAQAIQLWETAARAADHLERADEAAAVRAKAEHLRNPEYRGQNWRPDEPARG